MESAKTSTVASSDETDPRVENLVGLLNRLCYRIGRDEGADADTKKLAGIAQDYLRRENLQSYGLRSKEDRDVRYFVTCFSEAWMQESRKFFSLPYDEKALENPSSHRCFGYFESYQRAELAVLSNEMDLHECCYVWAAIEAIGPGIHAFSDPEKTRWFRYNLKAEKWEPSPTPEVVGERLVNLSIG